jgi:hypothetical protein
VASPQPGGETGFVLPGLEVSTGGEHRPVLADDEGAVENGEGLEGLADGRVHHVPLRLAHALERVEGDLAALLHHPGGGAHDEDGAHGVPLVPLGSHLERDVDHLLHHLGAMGFGEVERVHLHAILVVVGADLDPNQRVEALVVPGQRQDGVSLLHEPLALAGDERHPDLLHAGVAERGNDDGGELAGHELVGERLGGHRVDQLALDGAPSQVARGERRVAHVDQPVHLRSRRQRECGLDEGPLDPSVGHVTGLDEVGGDVHNAPRSSLTVRGVATSLRVPFSARSAAVARRSRGVPA